MNLWITSLHGLGPTDCEDLYKIYIFSWIFIIYKYFRYKTVSMQYLNGLTFWILYLILKRVDHYIF